MGEGKLLRKQLLTMPLIKDLFVLDKNMLPVETVPIPATMQHLKRDERGYPVFFTLGDNIQFKGIVSTRVFECAAKQLCGICGKPLRTSVTKSWLPAAFIGGAFSGLITHCFNDPLMHLECATYASKVCPWMVMTNYRRSSDEDLYKPHPAGVDLRPKIFAMVSSIGFRVFPDGLFKAHRPQVIKLWKPGSNDTPTLKEVEDYLRQVESEIHSKNNAAGQSILKT